MEGEDHHLELGSNSFIAGFEEQLIGAGAGDSREVKVTFPEKYANDKLSGRDAVFAVTIKEVLESVPADLDDEFAAKLGEKDLDGVKQKVRERLASEYKDFGRGRMKRQLLDQLAEGHEFPVPQAMVDGEFDAIWKQIEEDREAGKLDAEDAAKSEDDLKSEYREIAERRVRLGLLISEVGRSNGIEVSQEELNRALMQEAQRHPGHEREVFEFFQRTPETMSNLRAPIFEDKVVDFIVDLAKVSERKVTAAELRKEMDAEAAGTGAGQGKKTKAKAGAKEAGGKAKEAAKARKG